jgi:hypothetical protein
MDATDLITQAAAATMFAKVLVDIVKTSPIPSPTAVLPVLALLFGEGCAFLLFIAGGGVLSHQTEAQIGLVGILAAGSAIGVTALQNKSNEGGK